MAFKIKRQKKYHANARKHRRLLLFSAFFGVTGGILLLLSTRAAVSFVAYPPHRAQCIENSPSKTVVKPNEVFTAVVRMKNTGTSVWSPSYGFFLSEYSSVATSGITYWNTSGNTFTGSVNPGQTKTFNLTLRAPSQTGTYGFNWGMHIVYAGYLNDVCQNKTVQVMNPPVVNLQLNSTSGNITVTKGSALILNWLAGPSITSCTASGSWSGSKPAGGTETRTGDTSTTGTKSYGLVCSNAVGSASITRSVTVVNPPSSGGSTGGGSSGGSTSTPRSPSGSSSGGSTSTTNTPDTSAPSVPTEFVAEAMPDSTVALRWSASSDNVGVKGYQVDRSTDQTNWQTISGNELIDHESISDTDVSYETKYFYRVRAGDEAGNFSSYASTEVTTSPFAANTSIDKETSLTSDDGLITVLLPAGAVGVAQCNLRVNNAVLPPNKDGFKPLAGPYQVLCKNSAGTIISSFSSPVTVSVTLNEQQKNDHEVLSYMVYGDDWEEIETSSTESLKSFELTDDSTFAIMADAKATPWWKTVLKVLGVLALVVGGALLAINFFLRIKQRRAIQNQYEDYYHKERGY